MNIPDQLMLEHSKKNAASIASYAAASPAAFKDLMNCMCSNNKVLAQRAAWSVNLAAEKDPSLITPYIDDLVSQLPREDVHPAVLRNTLRILQNITIPERHHGMLMDLCFKFIEATSTPVAVKVFALINLQRLSGIYPEIKNEIKLLVKEKWDTETAAFKARAKRLL
jgi:hypothetical protein